MTPLSESLLLLSAIDFTKPIYGSTSEIAETYLSPMPRFESSIDEERLLCFIWLLIMSFGRGVSFKDSTFFKYCSYKAFSNPIFSL